MKTKNGVTIKILESTKMHMMAHSDVKIENIEEAINKIDYNGGFYMEAIDLGRIIGQTSCVEVNKDDNVEYFYRKNRYGKTPFVKGKVKKDTSKIVIGLTNDRNTGEPMLLTAFYGERAPMEPWDAMNKKRPIDEIEACERFWRTHALIYDESAIDFDR